MILILIIIKKKVIKDNERVDTNFIGVNPNLFQKEYQLTTY